ncbi:MAG: hypothetical protein M1836_005681 [Candelina mexicana]|nr:MAG: hypothetical protein M1836_005681 [Candelina mexicana]
MPRIQTRPELATIFRSCHESGNQRLKSVDPPMDPEAADRHARDEVHYCWDVDPWISSGDDPTKPAIVLVARRFAETMKAIGGEYCYERGDSEAPEVIL